IDFDLGGIDVAAAKAGTVIYANDSHTLNAYASGAWWYWNVVIIRHADYQYSIYGHLAPNSIPQAIKSGCTSDYSRPNCNVPVLAGDVIAQEGSTGYSSAAHLHVEFGQQFGIVGYPDLLDEDGDGDRSDTVYAGHTYAEQNIAFRGYRPSDVASWPYGTIHQASHQPTPPAGVNLVRNGDFSAGTDQWQPAGQINWAVEDGVLHVMRLNTTELPDWALFYQDLYYGGAAHMPFTVTLKLGNASGIPKYVEVSLLSTSGERYGIMTCAYTLEANTPLQTYTLSGLTESTWANSRLRVVVNPPDSAPAVLVDDIYVEYAPDALISTTTCS
ncbi:MAG: M23 family metallopeptidase, partial [Anaerolineae bacterium]|nr:M23 family metallopeptidase [Anaerolineae bacterium]